MLIPVGQWVYNFYRSIGTCIVINRMGPYLSTHCFTVRPICLTHSLTQCVTLFVNLGPVIGSHWFVQHYRMSLYRHVNTLSYRIASRYIATSKCTHTSIQIN